MQTAEWVKTSKAHTCQVCGRPSWCTFTRDGAVAKCMRVPSDKPVASGGYIHKLADTDEERARRLAEIERQPKPKPAPKLDAERFHQQCLEQMTPDLAGELSQRLGLSVATLANMGAGWACTDQMRAAMSYCDEPGCWTFPMRDAGGKVIGIRTRTLDGQKKSVTGSRNGLFIPQQLRQGDRLHLPEGPTDTAAMVQAGYAAIGRPMAAGANDIIAGVCHGVHVVIVADRDDAKRAPGGAAFWPGFDGAMGTAEALMGVARSVRIVMPPAVGQDVRDLLAERGGVHVFRRLVERARPVTPDQVQAWRRRHAARAKGGQA